MPDFGGVELTELGEQRLEGAELGLQVGDGLRGQGGGQGRVLFRSGFRSVQGAETDLAAGHHELFSRLGGDMMYRRPPWSAQNLWRISLLGQRAVPDLSTVDKWASQETRVLNKPA